MALVKKNTKSQQHDASWRAKDPFFLREAEKYGNPLPSREWILEYLSTATKKKKIDAEALVRYFSIQSQERSLFLRRIHAMVRDGQIEVDSAGKIRALASEKPSYILCRVWVHREGYGFATPVISPEETSRLNKKDWIIPEREMRYLMPDDQVRVQLLAKTYRGRQEVRVAEIVARGQDSILGEVVIEQGCTYVHAKDKRIKNRMLIDPSQSLSVEAGQIVVAKILSYPSLVQELTGAVVENVGMQNDAGIEIEIALRKHHLPHKFSQEVQLWVKRYIPPHISDKSMEGREDLRGLPFVTIDGENAKDFDDAVCVKFEKNCYRLWVAIADVSHYVPSGQLLDQEAYERATSVYFPRRVIPMLPEEISNGICSLNPQVDRLCMVCEMLVNGQGEINDYRFYPAIMHSQARLTYTQVHEWLNEGREYPESHIFLQPHLEALQSVFQVLLQARFKRGAVDFITQETEILFNAEGRIEKIQPSTRNEAHRIIEECMLAANVCAANFLLKHEHDTLFRVHEGPTVEKLNTLRVFLQGLGLSLGGGEKPHAKDYALLADQVRQRPDAELIHTALLRSMQQAVYQPKNIGHFGLAYEHYTHFTSPIRRYPDLLVHRCIKAILEKSTYRPSNSWEEMGKHCSANERRADEASREVENYLKCLYMKEHVGEIFTGKISGVVGFGVFVMLDELLVEGLVHVSDLGDDYFVYRPELHAMRGERSGKIFSLGQPVRIQVARSNPESSQIDFIWAK
jgi:ribonuclease R